jgi:GNAT superfamily N-acetyltransferase
MPLSWHPATPDDAPAIATLRRAVAEHLTARYGKGHWSWMVTERGVLSGLRRAKVLLGSDESGVIATLCLATKKPWAIDTSYFTPCRKPIYLTDMAIAPERQRQGIGRLCLEQAQHMAREWPGGAIRLDAYDGAAGAGDFYAKCGFREVGRVTYRATPLIYFERMV